MKTLAAIARQPVHFDSIVVVDNDPARSAEQGVRGASHTYIAAGANIGPAGGFHLGVESVLRHANDEDWIVFIDDDNPPFDDAVILDVFTTIDDGLRAGRKVGAAGPGGALLNRNGLLRRVPDAATGLVAVQYIGSGNYPAYSVRALRAIRLDPSPLFFGFEDLAIGLALNDSGYELLIDGGRLRERRRRRGVLGKSPREARQGHEPPAWRRYYSSRNLVALVGQHRSPLAHTLCAVRECAAAVRAGFVTRDPERFWASLAGVSDALRRRTGLRYLPVSPLKSAH